MYPNTYRHRSVAPRPRGRPSRIKRPGQLSNTLQGPPPCRQPPGAAHFRQPRGPSTYSDHHPSVEPWPPATTLSQAHQGSTPAIRKIAVSCSPVDALPDDCEEQRAAFPIVPDPCRGQIPCRGKLPAGRQASVSRTCSAPMERVARQVPRCLPCRGGLDLVEVTDACDKSSAVAHHDALSWGDRSRPARLCRSQPSPMCSRSR